MKMKTARITSLIGTLFLMTSCVCSDRHESRATQEPAQDSVAARAGKPSASLTMDYVIEGERAQIGVATTIVIRYSSTTGGAELLSANVRASDGLEVVHGPESSEFAMNGTKVFPQQTVIVRPTSAGLHYLNVDVKLVSNGRDQRRAFAIPVQVD